MNLPVTVPADRYVRFKLHAKHRTVAEAGLRNGRMIRLDVHPADRRAGVEIPGWLS